jgi:hypothetical protein
LHHDVLVHLTSLCFPISPVSVILFVVFILCRFVWLNPFISYCVVFHLITLVIDLVIVCNGLSQVPSLHYFFWAITIIMPRQILIVSRISSISPSRVVVILSYLWLVDSLDIWSCHFWWFAFVLYLVSHFYYSASFLFYW